MGSFPKIELWLAEQTKTAERMSLSSAYSYSEGGVSGNAGRDRLRALGQIQSLLDTESPASQAELKRALEELIEQGGDPDDDPMNVKRGTYRECLRLV